MLAAGGQALDSVLQTAVTGASVGWTPLVTALYPDASRGETPEMPRSPQRLKDCKLTVFVSREPRLRKPIVPDRQPAPPIGAARRDLRASSTECGEQSLEARSALKGSEV